MKKKRMAFVSTLGLYLGTIACDPPKEPAIINNPPEQKLPPDTAEESSTPEKTDAKNTSDTAKETLPEKISPPDVYVNTPAPKPPKKKTQTQTKTKRKQTNPPAPPKKQF